MDDIGHQRFTSWSREMPTAHSGIRMLSFWEPLIARSHNNFELTCMGIF